MKLYEKYLKNKLNDKNKIYLFKSGIFYICLGDDAKLLNEKYNFTLVPFNNEVSKCGFPIKSFDRYSKMLDSDKISYEIVKDSDPNCIIKKLEKINIAEITPIEALNILDELVKLI